MTGYRENSGYRFRVSAKLDEICPEDVFQKPSYEHLLRSLARELTGGQLSIVRLYKNPKDNRLGWCDGRAVWINLGNQVTNSFPTLSLKNVSLIGILGHECGHKRYSDFDLLGKYLKGFRKGIWYPHPPRAETEAEAEDLKIMREYFEKKDKNALGLMMQVASYLNNLLEDVYVEERMCAKFPGSIKRGILMNRSRNVEEIPTLRELLQENEDAVTVLMNLCGQYALSGRINNWDGEESELLGTIKELAPIIQKAVREEAPSARFLAANRILLKIWKYLYDIIQKLEEEHAKRSKEPGEATKEAEEPGEGEAADEQPDGTSENQESGTGAQDSGNKSREGEGTKKEESEPQMSGAMRKYLIHLVTHIPQFSETDPKEPVFERTPENVGWTGTWETDEKGDAGWQQSEEPNGAVPKEKKEGAFPVMLQVDAETTFRELLWQMAEEKVRDEMDQELSHRLLQDLLSIETSEFDPGHKRIKKEICRNSWISEPEKRQLASYEDKIRETQKRLRAALLPILRNQKTRTERRLFMGKKLDMRSIADPQGAVFRKERRGKKTDLALAVLLDLSESMTGKRMEQSKLAALCLYEFCQKAGIPIAVYGHHTDGYFHRALEEETVYLHCCAEFIPDKNDRYRIAALRPDGANRDGVALWFMGKRLLGRPEKQKLLVLISDGLPNSNQYRGEKAVADLKDIKKELSRKGVLFLAGAIGSDKERIREIYQEAFLDLSDLEKLPVLLMKQVLKYIRRD